jgi:hypothetical protein
MEYFRLLIFKNKPFMKFLFFITLFTIFYSSSIAQDTVKLKAPSIKSRTYEAKVNGENGVLYDHYLVEIQDSAILVSPKAVPFNMYTGATGSLKYLAVSDIESIALRRKGSAGRGALTGGLIGVGLGIIIGLASGDDKPGWFSMSAGDKALALGMLMGGSGSMIGLVSGAMIHRKFHIGRSKENLQRMNMTLLEKIYLKQQ